MQIASLYFVPQLPGLPVDQLILVVNFKSNISFQL